MMEIETLQAVRTGGKQGLGMCDIMTYSGVTMNVPLYVVPLIHEQSAVGLFASASEGGVGKLR